MHLSPSRFIEAQKVQFAICLRFKNYNPRITQLTYKNVISILILERKGSPSYADVTKEVCNYLLLR